MKTQGDYIKYEDMTDEQLEICIKRLSNIPQSVKWKNYQLRSKEAFALAERSKRRDRERVTHAKRNVSLNTVPYMIYLLYMRPETRAVQYSDMIDTAIRWNV